MSEASAIKITKARSSGKDKMFTKVSKASASGKEDVGVACSVGPYIAHWVFMARCLK